MPIQPGRRINPAMIQGSMREVGRIRSGDSEAVEGKTWRRPRRSDTLILTSVQQRLIVAAAAMWGGEPEQWTPQGSNVPVWRVVTDTPEIPAVLPQGYPLSTMFEMWQGGKCLRRCDGLSEEKSAPSPVPCVCRANFGPQWYERDQTNPPSICKITGRLNVYLEGLGDFGYWRIDVHSFYAVTEMSGFIDWVKARLGPDPSVRIRIAIEQRARGKTMFPVVAVRLADDTAIQILSGVAPKLMVEGLPDRRALTAAPPSDEPGPEERPALTAAPTPPPAPPAGGVSEEEWAARFDAATDRPELAGLWKQAGAGTMSERLKGVWKAAAARIDQPPTTAPADEPPPDTTEVIDAQAEPDKRALWTEVLELTGQRRWNTDQVAEHMRTKTGHDPISADGWAMEIFLNALKTGEL